MEIVQQICLIYLLRKGHVSGSTRGKKFGKCEQDIVMNTGIVLVVLLLLV